MVIVIDARGIENRIDGIGRFTLNVIRNLKGFTDCRFIIITLTKLQIKLPEFENVTYLNYTIPRFSFREIVKLPRIVNKISPDLYLNTSPYLFPGIKSKCIMILHDLMACNFKPFFKDSNFFKKIFARQFFKLLMRFSIKKATRVITVSNFTANEIIKNYKIKSSIIDIVYEASEFKLEKDLTNLEREKILKELELPEKFFLHVGNLKPYKNIHNILVAYHKFLQKDKNNRNIKFVFTVNKNLKEYIVFYDYLKKYHLIKNIIQLEYIDNEKLPLLYNVSLGLFFPSLVEGFGLPVLEAMACRTPVVTSKSIATEEIANGNAFLVDPDSIASLVKGLEYLATGRKLNRMNEAFEHALSFTWDKTTEMIIQSCKKTLLL